MDINPGDDIRYRRLHTGDIWCKAIGTPDGDKINVQSCAGDDDYRISLAWIAEVQRVIPGEGTVTVYQKEALV